MFTDTKTAHRETQIGSLSQRVAVATVAGLLGFFLLFGVAFANSNLLHSAAHDTRHAGTFPCH